MFGSRREQAALAALQSENSDLRSQLRLERAQFAEERQVLLDRLLAATSPSTLREVRRAPDREPRTTVPPQVQRRRSHFPGSAPTLRPPSPPSLPTPGAVSLTDTQVQAITTASDTLSATEQN